MIKMIKDLSHNNQHCQIRGNLIDKTTMLLAAPNGTNSKNSCKGLTVRKFLCYAYCIYEKAAKAVTKRVHFAAALQRTFRPGLRSPVLLRGMGRRKWNMASEQRTELPGFGEIYPLGISAKEWSKAATGSACYSG